jgi:RNA polymerase sigma-70 factor, ECF subfamily
MTREQRFRALYEAHAGAVLRYARRRAFGADAEDVLAEVFLVAWRRLDDVPENGGIWLLGVARRVLANQRRGRTRQLAVRDRLALDTRGGDASTLEPRGAGRVAQALDRLSERDRELLLLLAWEGLTNDEAAGVLQIQPRTLRVRLHRARRRFAQALEEDAPAEGAADPSTALEAT